MHQLIRVLLEQNRMAPGIHQDGRRGRRLEFLGSCLLRPERRKEQTTDQKRKGRKNSGGLRLTHS